MKINYDITEKIISFIANISEKIGRIKEIRKSNKHIDFDLLCNAENIRSYLEYNRQPYPHEEIIKFLKNKPSSLNSSEYDNFETTEKVIRLYSAINNNSKLSFDSYIQLCAKDGLLKEAQIEKSGKKRKINTNTHILYSLADFCNHYYNKVRGGYFEKIWLVISLYQEYGLLLYFPYNNHYYLKKEKFTNGKGGDQFYDAKIKSENANSTYPLYEFYLSLIEQVVDRNLELHYKLTRPIADRVVMLKGVIKEPFSRKEYMIYHKISTATASLDLKKAVLDNILSIEGHKNTARYRYRDETDIINLVE